MMYKKKIYHFTLIINVLLIIIIQIVFIINKLPVNICIVIFISTLFSLLFLYIRYCYYEIFNIYVEKEQLVFEKYKGKKVLRKLADIDYIYETIHLNMIFVFHNEQRIRLFTSVITDKKFINFIKEVSEYRRKLFNNDSKIKMFRTLTIKPNAIEY